MPHSHYEVWCRRWQALQSTIQHHLRRTADAEQSIDRQATLASLLTSLQRFGKSQVEFFVHGFDPAATVRLEPSTLYPPEYALRATLDQIAYDLDVIQRAQSQRARGTGSREMRETLARADHLAYRALEPAIRQGWIENTTVVTYFQKIVNVRIIPYAPVAMIGLPLSTLMVARDLLAIPHEVGHYLFRYGRVQHGLWQGSRFDAALIAELPDLPQWALNWLEEIFADVYGALVAGPIMALGFEDLVTDDSFAELVEDDGEHPIGALRLAIYHRVLANLGCYGAELTALQARWERWVEQHAVPTSFVPAGQSVEIEVQAAKTVLETMVDRLMAGELGQLQTDRTLWSATLAAGADVEELISAFETMAIHLDPALASQVPEVELREAEQGENWLHLAPLASQSGLAPVRRKVGMTGRWSDALKEAKGPFNVPPQVWTELLDESGWAVEGPGSNAHKRVR